jgi:hypothetical protein
VELESFSPFGMSFLPPVGILDMPMCCYYVPFLLIPPEFREGIVELFPSYSSCHGALCSILTVSDPPVVHTVMRILAICPNAWIQGGC